MSTHLLTLTTLLCATVSANTDTVVPVPTTQGRVTFNVSDASGSPGIVNMHGQNSYHAAQQIFYIDGPQHWGRLRDNSLVGKAEKGYLITPGLGAHKLHIRKLTWNKARHACIQEGGHLAIINSISEEKLLLRILDENKLNDAWLGVHDLYEEGDWVTLFDEAIETAGYSRWTTKFANEPDNFDGKQHCGVLLKEGGMNDINCNSQTAFFCETTV